MNKIIKQINSTIKTFIMARSLVSEDDRTALASLKFAKWIIMQPDFELLNTYYIKLKLKEYMERAKSI